MSVYVEKCIRKLNTYNPNSGNFMNRQSNHHYETLKLTEILQAVFFSSLVRAYSSNRMLQNPTKIQSDDISEEL